MRTRKAELLAAESTTTVATRTIDIGMEEPISRISIRFKGTNSSSTPTAHPAAMVSKIELVDGSDVLFSCSGYEAQAMDHYMSPGPRLDVMDYIDDEMAIPVFNINFGRHLWDRTLAFDPKRFRNPQLKITHNKASGGSAPDAGTMRVHADVFDEDPPTPMGFLMTKEWYSYSLVSAGYETFELPTDHPLRMMLVMARFGGKQPHDQVNEIRLSENSDKRIPFDNKVTDWLPYISSQYPKVSEMVRIKPTAATAMTVYITPCYEAVFVPTSALTAGHFLVQESYGGTESVTPEQTGDCQCNCMGYAPHGAIPIPMGDQGDIDDWFDVRKLTSLKMRLKGGSAVGSSSTAEVVTQQLRAYA